MAAIRLECALRMLHVAKHGNRHTIQELEI